jgi:hypothetical protein
MKASNALFVSLQKPPRKDHVRAEGVFNRAIRGNPGIEQLDEPVEGIRYA